MLDIMPLLPLIGALIGASPNSLMKLIASLKVKTMEG
jgi:hypothetical protein